jgi:two-component SAPR family response regulator
MRIFVLDDEPIALRVSKKIVQEVMPDSQITGFGNADQVFTYIDETGMKPDVVFSDIEMPGMSGLEFAVHLKKKCPNAVIIFVTAYSQYALEAFRLHVHGYILKPLTTDRVKEELEHALEEKKSGQPEQDDLSPESDLKQRQKNLQEQLKVECFGNFEVYWKNMPLMFGRRQTKELLAFLVDRRGTACTPEEIAQVLWQNQNDLEGLSAQVLILLKDLKRVLDTIGREDIIISRGGKIAIRKDAIDCDYYRMLAGDMYAVNSYQGEYMAQYTWAEITDGKLEFEK